MSRDATRVPQSYARGTFLSLVLICLSAAALTAPPANATTVAGRTAGSFAVSPTGAATYSIPIWAPPGPNGMQPQMALTYNSQGGNGYVGVGWGLSGLSTIYRCNLTFAQDAAPAPVALAVGDGYCIDGQRLRLTSGTYGEAGSTYQTEVADFRNVTAYGTAGNGPAYFVVKDRNGRTYTYGDGGSSQVLANGSSTAVMWELNEVADPAGNTMTIAYSTATGSSVPSVISWTPTTYGGSSYAYTMSFAYGTNVVPPQGYVGGTSFENANLLSSITVASSGTTVKKYVLTYQASPTTGRDRLTQVQECSDSAGSNCLLPTTISYQNGAAGVSTSATTAVSSGAGALLYVNYDFNGDGYKDLVYCNGSNIVYVSFGSATGYGTPVNTGLNCTRALYGDLQGTGKDGILVPNGSTWYYYTWNGSSFTGVSTGLAYDSTAQQYLLADVNGDGLPDLISSYATTGSGPQGTTYGDNVYIRLNTTPAGGAPSFSSSTTLAYSYGPVFNFRGLTLQSQQQYGPGRGFDFNGDGRQDLAMQMVTGTTSYTVSTYELISTGTAFTATEIASTPGSLYLPVFFLNFNDDACTDYVFNGTIYVSGCNGSVPSTLSIPGGAAVLGAMDWNGDGLTDILVQNGSTIGVYESTGAGLSSLITTSIPYNASNVYLSFDATGDGQDDLGVWTSAGAVSYYVHNGANTPPDLLTSVADGYGNSASPTYVSIVQNNYAETGYGTATYPDQYYIGPLYAVKEVVFSDPSSTSGGTYNQTFWYFGAWTNLQGRGFESFYAMRYLDSRNSLYFYRYFERSFPYTGMQFESLVTNGSFYPTQTVNTLASLVTLSSTEHQERYFPYFNNSTTYTKEVGGSENGDLITTSSTNYTFDNYGNPTSVARTVTDNDPGSPYNGDTWTTTTTNTPDVDTTHWCLGLFTETQVAYSSTLSGSGSVTRTKTMTPDTTNCRYTQIVTEPSSSQFKVTENLGYDSFGNVNSDSVTGVGMGTASPATRTTTTSWTSSTVTTGQFPMSVTDPSGAQTQFSYNLSYGLKSGVTDPNGLTTSWQYTDGFGRKTKETRPDGTYTVFSYYNCASTTTCLVGTNGLNVGADVYSTTGTLITYGGQYFDPVGRTVMTESLMLSGSVSRTDQRYDSLGRVSERSFPCTYTAFTTACTYWTTNSYDVLNRPTQSQRPISSTNSNLQTTTYAYAGRTTTVTDPQTNARVAVTDVNGWLRSTKDPMGYSVTMAYDSAGAKTKVTDSLGNTLWSGTYSYGIKAFLTGATDMDMGSWGFTIDALGEKTAWTDAKSQSFSQTYDALSRPLTRTEPDLFTQWTWGSSASSHNIGRLQSDCTGTGSACSSSGYAESDTYDSLGRKSQRAITLPGYTAFTYTWGYDATTGLLSTVTYPTSTAGYALELQYGYANGVLSTVTDISDTPNVTVWTANTMDPAGHVTEETLGNGIVTSRSYDAVTQWLGSAQSGVSGGSGVKNLAFLYDEMGNVTQRQDNNLGLTENIYYDNDYRFSYSKLDGTQNLSVTYDGTGNITSRSDVAGGAAWTYSTTQKHAVTQAGSSAFQLAYDANGNATSRQGDSITWTSYNYPTYVNAGSGSTAEAVSFSYGPDRSRWAQNYTGNSTTEGTYYVGGLLEVVSSGGVIDYRHYIYAGTEPVAVYSRKNNGTQTFSYVLQDHQASVSSITNSSGAQVVGESFDAFGSRRNPTTWSGAPSNSDLTTIAGITREGYTFQTALGLWMGLNHMNGRVEDSITGRMLSGDPHIPDRANAQAYNRYSYVYNNPLTFTDPTGWARCPNGGGQSGGVPKCMPNNPDNAGPRCLKCMDFDPGVPTGADLVLQDLENTLNGSSDAALAGVPLMNMVPTTNDSDGLTGVQVTAQYVNPATGQLLPLGWSVSPDGTVTDGPKPQDPGPQYVATGFVTPNWPQGGTTSQQRSTTSPQEQPVHGPWTYGNWCGPGGSGSPKDALDAGCQQHDYCYGRNHLTVWSNFGPSNAALQGCNQQLCGTARGIQFAVQLAPFPQPGMPSADEYFAATEINYYFSNVPLNGNGCH